MVVFILNLNDEKVSGWDLVINKSHLDGLSALTSAYICKHICKSSFQVETNRYKMFLLTYKVRDNEGFAFSKITNKPGKTKN